MNGKITKCKSDSAARKLNWFAQYMSKRMFGFFDWITTTPIPNNASGLTLHRPCNLKVCMLAFTFQTTDNCSTVGPNTDLLQLFTDIEWMNEWKNEWMNEWMNQRMTLTHQFQDWNIYRRSEHFTFKQSFHTPCYKNNSNWFNPSIPDDFLHPMFHSNKRLSFFRSKNGAQEVNITFNVAHTPLCLQSSQSNHSKQLHTVIFSLCSSTARRLSAVHVS